MEHTLAHTLYATLCYWVYKLVFCVGVRGNIGLIISTRGELLNFN